MILIFEHQESPDREIKKIGIPYDQICTVEEYPASNKTGTYSFVLVLYQIANDIRSIRIYGKTLEEVCTWINIGKFEKIK